MTNEELKEWKALKAAYEICFVVEDVTANIIASGEATESDKDSNKKSKVYIKWFLNKMNK